MDLQKELSKGLGKAEIDDLLRDYYVNRLNTEHLLLRYQVPLKEVHRYVSQSIPPAGAKATHGGEPEPPETLFDTNILEFVADTEGNWLDHQEKALMETFWGTPGFHQGFLDYAKDLKKSPEWNYFEKAIAKIAKGTPMKVPGNPLKTYFICKNVAFLYVKLFLFATRVDKIGELELFQKDIVEARDALANLFRENCKAILPEDYNPDVFAKFMQSVINLREQALGEIRQDLVYRALSNAPKSGEGNKFRIRIMTVMLARAKAPVQKYQGEMTKRAEKALEEMLDAWLSQQMNFAGQSFEDPLQKYLAFIEQGGAPLISQRDLLDIEEAYANVMTQEYVPPESIEDAYRKITGIVCEDFDPYEYTLKELKEIHRALVKD